MIKCFCFSEIIFIFVIKIVFGRKTQSQIVNYKI